MFAPARLSLGFLSTRERVEYFILVGLRALAGLLDVFGLFLIGFLTAVGASQLATRRSEPLTVLGFQLPALDESALVLLVLLVLLVFTVKAAIAIMLTRILANFLAGVETRSSTSIADFLLRGSLGDVKKYSKAEVQWAITGSTTYAFSGILNGFAVVVSESFLLVVVGATFFLVDPVAAIAVVIYFTLVIILIQVVIGSSLKRAGQDSGDGTMGTTGAINDTLDTFREISVLAKQDLFVDRIRANRVKVSRAGATMAFLSGMPRYVVETALMLGVVLFVGQQFLTGQLAAGIVTIGVFLTGGVRVMASLLPLQNAVAGLKTNGEQARLAQALLMEVRATPVAIRSPADIVIGENLRASSGGLTVDLQGVSYRFPEDDHDTLRDITLRIEAGTHVAFIGPSGAGKTTLVDLILGLIEPRFGNATISGIHPADLRILEPGLIAYVPQKPGLITGSIAENITLGLRADQVDPAKLERAVEAAHLTEFIASLPMGVETVVGKQADSLSGGQIQRIGLARALYVEPRLLILDEATSALDAGSEAFISRSLSDLGDSVTVIVIAHRLSTVQHSDVVFVVEGGEVTARGKFKDLRKTVPIVAEYVKLMSFDNK